MLGVGMNYRRRRIIRRIMMQDNYQRRKSGEKVTWIVRSIFGNAWFCQIAIYRVGSSQPQLRGASDSRINSYDP